MRLLSRSMPHIRMAVVSVRASGRRRMMCRALLYFCLASWLFLVGRCCMVGRVSPGISAPNGGRLGMIRLM